MSPLPFSFLARTLFHRTIRTGKVVYTVRVGDAPVKHRREPEHRFVTERAFAPRTHWALIVQHVCGQVQGGRILMDHDGRQRLVAGVRVRFDTGRVLDEVGGSGFQRFRVEFRATPLRAPVVFPPARCLGSGIASRAVRVRGLGIETLVVVLGVCRRLRVHLPDLGRVNQRRNPPVGFLAAVQWAQPGVGVAPGRARTVPGRAEVRFRGYPVGPGTHRKRTKVTHASSVF